MRNFVAKRALKKDDATDSLTLEEFEEDFYSLEGEEEQHGDSGIFEFDYNDQDLDDDIGLY
jgi:hypothetical protein